VVRDGALDPGQPLEEPLALENVLYECPARFFVLFHERSQFRCIEHPDGPPKTAEPLMGLIGRANAALNPIFGFPAKIEAARDAVWEEMEGRWAPRATRYVLRHIRTAAAELASSGPTSWRRSCAT
jgi:hypothetical protein